MNYWRWTIFGLTIGLIASGSSQFIIAPLISNEPLEMLFLILGFLLMGMAIGLFSPGGSLMQRSISGVVLVFIMIGLLFIAGREGAEGFSRVIFGLLLGFILSFVGIWIGEKIQREEEITGRIIDIFQLQGKWISIAVSAGVLANLVFLFLIRPFFKVNDDVSFIIFLLSFMLIGFIVGWKVTERLLYVIAMSGFIGVLFTGASLILFIDSSIGGMYIIFNLMLGFILTFLGAWLGEKFRPLLGD